MISQYFLLSWCFLSISFLCNLIDWKPFDSCCLDDGLSSMGSGLGIFHFHTLVNLKLDIMRLHRLCLLFFQHCLRLIQFPRTLFTSKNSISLALSQAVAQRCSVKKMFFKISENSQGNTCTRSSFLIKLQAN